MILDKRSYTVLAAIAENPNIKGTELEKKFVLSRKQLSYTIQKINDYLLDNDFEPIKRLKTGNIQISKAVMEAFGDFREDTVDFSKYIFSEMERLDLILFFLLCRNEELSLFHLSSAFHVSKNTILGDIKKLQPILNHMDLLIQYDRDGGYRIRGSELAKRRLLIDNIRQIMNMPMARSVFSEYGNLNHAEILQITQAIVNMEEKLKVKFTDQRLEELIYLVWFLQIRIKQGKTIQNLPSAYMEAKNSNEFSYVIEMLIELGITDEYEQLFVTVLFQSSNIQAVMDKDHHLDEQILASVVRVINNFESVSCIQFHDRTELIEMMYQHWKPAYYRILYNMPANNSVYDMVLMEYGHLHNIVRKSIEPFQAMLASEIPDEEAAFITVIIGGWLMREGMLEKVQEKKTAIVVCVNGVTVSNYLFLSLKSLLPELYFSDSLSMREFERYENHYDVVFSTTHLQTQKPLFVVNPFLNDFHKQMFKNKVLNTLQGVESSMIRVDELMAIMEKYGNIFDEKNMRKELDVYLHQDKHRDQQSHDYAQRSSLADLMSADCIQICSEHDLSWQAAIEMAAQPLMVHDLIQMRYVQAMIQNILVYQPYIMIRDGLILAHAGIDDGVNGVGMSLLRLPKRIDINGYMQADIIVVLATPDKERHLKALSQFNEFLEEEQGDEKIRHAGDEQVICRLMEGYH